MASKLFMCLNKKIGLCVTSVVLNWWKGKPSEKTAASVLLKLFISSNDATPLTPPSAWAELHFQM